jgi:hypothetical protein
MLGNVIRRLFTKHRAFSGESIAPNLSLNQSDKNLNHTQKEAFPEVPSPDPPLTPLLLAARWISYDLHGEEMPGIAADLLEAGFDTPALRRLAGEIEIHSREDAEPLTKQVFRELGVPGSFSETHAKLIATRQIAREVIVGKRDPYSAASHLQIVLWNWKPATEDLAHLFLVSDEFEWDADEQRYLPALLTDQLQTFARLACLTDEQITVESHSHVPLPR